MKIYREFRAWDAWSRRGLGIFLSWGLSNIGKIVYTHPDELALRVCVCVYTHIYIYIYIFIYIFIYLFIY